MVFSANYRIYTDTPLLVKNILITVKSTLSLDFCKKIIIFHTEDESKNSNKNIFIFYILLQKYNSFLIEGYIITTTIITYFIA